VVSNAVRLKVFHERIRYICPVIIRDPRSGSFHIFHQSVEIVARIGDGGDSNRCAIPYGARFDFRDRNVEAGTQAVFQAAQHLPFIFE
jgi:hypothetical protein